MSIVIWPQDLAPSEMEFWHESNALVSRSPLSQAQQVQVRGPGRWRARMTFANRGPAIAARLDALLAEIDGPATEIVLFDFRRPVPLGTGAGYGAGTSLPTEWPSGTAWPVGTVWPSYVPPPTPRLRLDAAAGDDTLATHGWAPDETVLSAGDYVGIGGQLHIVTRDATSNLGGEATLTVRPRLRFPQAAGLGLVTERPVTAFRMVGAGGANPTVPGRFSSFTIEFEESLPGYAESVIPRPPEPEQPEEPEIISIGGVEIGTEVTGGDFGAGYTLVGGDDYDATVVQRIPRASNLFPSREMLLDSAFSERDGMHTSLPALGVTSGPYYTGHLNANQGVVLASFADVIQIDSSELRMKLRELTPEEEAVSGPRSSAVLPAITTRKFSFPAIITAAQAGHYGERILEFAIRFSGDWSVLDTTVGANWNPAGWGLTVDGGSEAGGNPDDDERDYFEALNWPRSHRAHIRHSPGFNQASQAFSGTFVSDQWRYFRVKLTASNVIIKVFSDAAMASQALATLTFSMSSASLAEIEYVLWDQVIQSEVPPSGTDADLALWAGKSVTMHVDWWRVWALSTARVDAVPADVIDEDRVLDVACGGSDTLVLPTRAELWPFTVTDERIYWMNAIGANGPGRAGGEFNSAAQNKNFTPPGLTVDLAGARTVSISGTYTATPGVQYGFLYARPSGGAGIARPHRFAIAVGPKWNAPSLPAATPSSSYSYTLPVDRFDVGNLVRENPVEMLSGPSWLSFNPATRQFGGTVPGDFSGSVNVTLRVTNGRGQVADAVVAINASGSVYDPTAIVGWVAGWDSNDAAKVSGATITNLTSGTLLGQGTAGNQPAVITNGGVTGDKRVLRFDNTNDFMQGTPSSLVNLFKAGNNQPCTIIMACRFASADGNAFFVGDNGNPQAGLVIRHTGTGNIISQRYGAGTVRTTPSIPIDTGWHVLTYQFDGTALSMQVDNGTPSTLSPATISGTGGTATAYLGASPPGGGGAITNFMDGDIAGALFFNAAISGPTLADAKAWVAATAGITL